MNRPYPQLQSLQMSGWLIDYNFRIDFDSFLCSEDISVILPLPCSSEDPNIVEIDIELGPRKRKSINSGIDTALTEDLVEPVEEEEVDEDKIYVLSLLEPLKELSPVQKAVVKMKIMKYIVEVQLGKREAKL